MADKGEPDPAGAARRSGSVMDSPLRLAVLIVFVAAGILILSKGFGPTSSAAGTTGGGSPTGGTTHTSPPPTTHRPSHSPATNATPPQTGITIAVRNSTPTPGLANDERQKLETDGWDVISIGNEHTAYTTTTIYYVSGAQTQATFIKSTYYPKGVVKAAPPAFQKAKISIVLGSDFSGGP